MSEKITASLASIYSRKDLLPDVLSSVYDQVDQLCVYLNDYPTIPNFLNDSKISVYWGAELGDRGDVGKFYPVFNGEGYIFTLDDDILYPNNYINILIERIEYYKRRVFVCIHGNILPASTLTSYYRDKRGLHFSKELLHDQQVDVPGTGTLGFHSSVYSFSEKDFTRANMSDIWLYKIGYENAIPVIAIAREAKWLNPVIGYSDSHSIYARSHKNDYFQTEVINMIRRK